MVDSPFSFGEAYVPPAPFPGQSKQMDDPSLKCLPGGVIRSSVHGNSHADTTTFDHYCEFVRGQIAAGSSVRMKRLEVWHQEFVFGFITTLEAKVSDGQIVEKTFTNMGSHHHGEYQKTVIELAEDEHIVRVTGRSGTILDRVEFQSDMGTSWTCGGSGGAEFKLLAPEGKQLLCFGGGQNGHIHFLYGYFK